MNFPSNKEPLHLPLPEEKAVTRGDDFIIRHIDWEDIGFTRDFLVKTGNIEVSLPQGSFLPPFLHFHPGHEYIVPEQALDVEPLVIHLADLYRV